MSLTFKLKMVFSVLCFFFKPASWHLLLYQYRSIHFNTHISKQHSPIKSRVPCAPFILWAPAPPKVSARPWSWPPCCSSVSGYWQSFYSLHHLYVEQQFFFSDPQRVLCHEVPCWTASDQYERVRAITPNLTHLLPIHTWDLVTLTSHMTPGRENG